MYKSSMEEPEEEEVVMKTMFQEGVELAESCEWDKLIERLGEDKVLATHRDHYGMIPLHWACTEADVPTLVLEKLLQAYPDGARTKNNAQMLPLHISIRANASKEWIQMLIDIYPSSVLVPASGTTLPWQLAMGAKLSAEGMEVLKKGIEKLEAMGNNEEGDEEERLLEINEQILWESELLDRRTRESISSAKSVERSSKGADRSSSKEEECGVCRKSLSSLFHLKSFKCYSCDIPLCKEHVGGKIELPNYFTKKTVCGDCMPEKLEEEERHTLQALRNSTLASKIRKTPSADGIVTQEAIRRAKSADSRQIAKKVEQLTTRVMELEGVKLKYEAQMAEQTTVLSNAMLLLTQTMTRVANLELQLGIENQLEDDEHAVADFESPFDEDFSDLPLSS